MILHQKLTTCEMADVARYSERSIKAIHLDLRYFRSTKAPLNSGGGCQSITLQILEILQEHLLKKPKLYLEEIAVFL
jgi:gamma-glutamyltranspeptidase